MNKMIYRAIRGFPIGCTLGLIFVLFLGATWDAQRHDRVGVSQGMPPITQQRILIVDRLAQNCSLGGVTTRFDPYSTQGIAAQVFNPEIPVYKESCLPLLFSTSHTFPKTALASHPGSGNTWTRYLVQQLTGVYIGSVYGDLLYSDNDVPIKFRGSQAVWNGSAIAIKTHEGWSGRPEFQPDRFDKAIVLMRDPRDSLLAEYKRTKWSHKSKNFSTDIFASEEFHTKYFNQAIKSWYGFHHKWLTVDMCVLIVQYEHLKQDLHNQLLRIAHYLDIDINMLKSSHLDCILNNVGGKLKWPSVTKWSDPYTKEMNATMERYRRRIRYIMTNMHGTTHFTF